MHKNRLGMSDLMVSKICLGTMTWGNQNTAEEAFEQLDYAVSEGVNFIDAAELYPAPMEAATYGDTERIIGRWLKQSGRRNDVVLATKMAGRGFAWIRDGEGLNPHAIEQAVDNSLSRLQTDTIDLYQLHWPQRDVQLWGRQNYDPSMFDAAAGEALETFYTALRNVHSKGKVRYLGLSNETPWGVMKHFQCAQKCHLPRMESIQNGYSIIRRDYETALAEISLAEHIGLLAYSPLAGGILSGKYRGGQFPEKSRYQLFPNLMGYYNNDRTEKALARYQHLADREGISLAQLALAFVNDQPFVTATIIGATTLEQLRENIASAHVSLSVECRQEIDGIFRDIPNPGNY